MAGDHRVEVVDRRVHVRGAHAIDVTVGRGEGLNALLEVAGQIQQPATSKEKGVGSLFTSASGDRGNALSFQAQVA